MKRTSATLPKIKVRTESETVDSTFLAFSVFLVFLVFSAFSAFLVFST
ncbi:MAG: hypothetical protein KBF89_00975 [Acidimicrobiia bacterium]|nr:hypothetical protein [Acidimicrobiia bacterium]